ncbi:MAG: inorganic diphosphatase [bacterium]|nr:inorganic diphosphatase [bacterium]
MKTVVDAIIEIPLKTKNKFEISEKTNEIRLDRVLYSAMNYPAEYGYIANTLALDGDPLDILVISSEPTFPGCVVPARVIGYLEVIDNGYQDYKLISVVDVDPRYNEINTLDDLSSFVKDEIINFFSNYKTLQKIEVIVKDYHGRDEAIKLIEECHKRFYNKENEKK